MRWPCAAPDRRPGPPRRAVMRTIDPCWPDFRRWSAHDHLPAHLIRYLDERMPSTPTPRSGPARSPMPCAARLTRSRLHGPTTGRTRTRAARPAAAPLRPGRGGRDLHQPVPAWHNRKVQGCWRTLAPLQRHCRIRSYLVSARNHGCRPLDAIRDALAANRW